MNTYLYRAIATEERLPEAAWDDGVAEGEILGRQSGYLSRSSAIAAGESSGVTYKVIRSKPVDFSQTESKHDKLTRALVDLIAEGVTGGATEVIAKQIQKLENRT